MRGKFLSFRASVTAMGLRAYFSDGEPKEKTFFLSPGIMLPDGRALGFHIRGITEKELREIKADSEKDLIFKVITKCVLQPELTFDCCERLFLPGEALRLFNEIVSAGGGGKNFDELKREVGQMLLKGEREAVYGCLAAFEMGIRPKEFALMDVREQACIAAFADEKIRIKKRKGR